MGGKRAGRIFFFFFWLKKLMAGSRRRNKKNDCHQGTSCCLKPLAHLACCSAFGTSHHVESYRVYATISEKAGRNRWSRALVSVTSHQKHRPPCCEALKCFSRQKQQTAIRLLQIRKSKIPRQRVILQQGLWRALLHPQSHLLNVPPPCWVQYHRPPALLPHAAYIEGTALGSW